MRPESRTGQKYEKHSQNRRDAADATTLNKPGFNAHFVSYP
jgi:hypothetical protein